jgi:hypothetical protein
MTTVVTQATRMNQASCFLRHLLEMTAAMMLGMMAYAVVVSGLLVVVGSSLEDARLGQPELFVVGMTFSMIVSMVVWMRHRGHGWRSSAEMSAAMSVPVFALVACYWLHAVSADSICPLACASMIPAMIVAMLYRLDDYTGHRPGRQLRRLRALRGG